jgi:serine/threonine protein kinase
MGEVYRATDRRLNRTVGIKILPPHFVRNQEMKQRFDTGGL